MTGLDRVSVLLAAGDEQHAATLAGYLEQPGRSVTVVAHGRDALVALRDNAYDVLLVDTQLPEVDGFELLRHVRTCPAPPEVIMIAGNGMLDAAGGALLLGASDVVSPPFRMVLVDATVRRAAERRALSRENQLLRWQLERLEPPGELMTQYAPLRAVMGLLSRIGESDRSVLVTGEAGTGKSLVARLIHQHSPRRAAPFVSVSLRDAVDQESVEGLLFGVDDDGGHNGGHRVGLLELASGGTVLLDGLEHLDTAVQKKVACLLESGVLQRVGGTQRVPVDARIVASSSMDGEALVATRTVRDELYARLAGATITLPPLRERTMDIPVLAAHFAGRRRRSGGTLSVSDEAVDVLRAYSWPGNVDELREVVDRAARRTGGREIQVKELPLEVVQGPRAHADDAHEVNTLELLERRHIERVLKDVEWHQGKAAEILGISPKTLYRKIREYGFRRPGAVRT
jgi:DNA-binding NtrC family response regulator